MKEYRKLYLQDSAGRRYDLNGKQNIWASELTGFGFTLSPVFADLKRGFFISSADDSEPQSTAACTLSFTGSEVYDDYRLFVNWMSRSGNLQLVYKPSESGSEYFRDIQVSYISKGEKNELGWLVVPASFVCLSPWYMPDPTELRLGTSDDSAMRFPFVFDENLRFGSSAASDFSGTIRAAGQVPGAILIKFKGAITNPRIRLVGQQTGTTYGICSVEAEFNSTDIFELSTIPTDSHVYKILPSGVVIDLLDVLDISTTPYFQVPVNESCTISLESDASFTGEADLLVYYYFRSV